MKILFFAEAVSLAHMGRPLKLAQWAKQRNMDVHFAASSNGLQKTHANALGFNTYPINTINENLFYERVNKGNFFYKKNELKDYIEEEQTIILKVKPDLIVSDFRLTTSISSELTNKKLLNLSNSYWSPNYACPFDAPETGIFKLLPQRASDIVFNIIRPFAFKFFGKELNQIRNDFGLKSKKDFRELYTDGSYTAYMDLPNFVKIECLPENHFFLGPIVWSPKQHSKALSEIEKSSVYISMGSTGNNFLLPQIISTSIKNNLRVIVSGINLSDKNALLNQFPQLLNESILEPMIDANEILPYCKLTICHGGSSTVYQSISNGIPVLCFPKNPDQGLVSMAVTKKNIGRHIRTKNINSTTIDRMIKECLTNEVLHQNAKNMQHEIKQWNTESRWNQFLNKFKTIRKPIKFFA